MKKTKKGLYHITETQRSKKLREIIVNDKMQQGYRYILSEPEGKNFAAGFEPELSPAEMLEMGVFEGKYLNDCQNEFPAGWWKNARLSPNGKADISQNCFRIKSRMSLQAWRQKGWIIAPDVRGWFQWYCRYYMGRRLPEIDAFQIKRWKAFKRHKIQVEKNCFIGDTDCRKKQRQALLQWAYNPWF